MSYHLISRKTGHGNRIKYTVLISLEVFCKPWCTVCLGITITKSNEDRVLDLSGVMPNSAEKNRHTWLILM
jgi:hypothetical protein